MHLKEMKLLECDAQTTNDLGIGWNQGSSVAQLFNHTVTEAGSLLLRQFFQHPMADHEQINKRSSVLKFFSEQEIIFPLDADMNSLQYYFENIDVRSQLIAESISVTQRLQQIVASDAGYLFVRDGVHAFLYCIEKLLLFTEKYGLLLLHSPYADRFEQLEYLLNDADFAQMISVCRNGKKLNIDRSQLTAFDKIIRFTSRGKVSVILELISEVDVFIAISNAARRNGFQFARALPQEESCIDMKGIYHPLVKNAIPNNVQLDAGRNVLFLTGANMAGKSTLMKSIGIVLYLAHMGFPVPADSVEFSVRDKIISSINLSDNLSAGASHYYAEVLRVKEMARSLHQKSRLLVIFDELFRGTNVTDAYDATVAITRAFGNFPDSQFILSTHIIEAGELLKNERSSISFKYLPTVMQEGMPQYPRILAEGISADRHGMIIIENEGIFKLLDSGIGQLEKQQA